MSTSLISSRLRVVLRKHHCTATRAAYLCSLHPNTFLKYTSSSRVIPPKVAARLAKHIPLNLHWLYTGEPLPPPPPLTEMEKATLQTQKWHRGKPQSVASRMSEKKLARENSEDWEPIMQDGAEME